MATVVDPVMLVVEGLQDEKQQEAEHP